MYGITKLDIPQSLEEALDILQQSPNSLPFAGGTDILVQMRANNTQNVHLVALKDLDELNHLFEDDKGIHIGPMVSYTQLALHPIIREKLPMLRTAALAMGGPQIQHLATIGGNICNGATSADGAAPLLALDAQLTLKCANGIRNTLLEDFYLGPGKVTRKQNELLVDITIPPLPLSGFGGVYEKFSTRKAMDIATLGCAATIRLAEDGTIDKATLAYCTAGPTPVRCNKAEERLVGQKDLSDELLDEVVDLASHATRPRSSWRASKEYRLNLIRELGKRNLRAAFDLARESL